MLGAREVDRIERVKLHGRSRPAALSPRNFSPAGALRTGGCGLAIGTPVRSVRL